MVLQIILKSTKQVITPLHYKTQIQGLLYSAMDEEHKNFLHNQGYADGPRSFRLFTFSDIQEKARRVRDKLIFEDEITVYFSSFDNDLCMSIAKNMMGNPQRLGRNHFDEVTVAIANPQVAENELKVQAVSPIVCYETLHHPDGRAYYNYFPADHPSFATEIRRNIIRKHNIIHPDDRLELPDETAANYENTCFKIEPLGKTKQEITFYKNFVIKGVRGEFLIKADPKLLQVALDCGLGSKNSQGFGMLMLNP